MKTTLIQFWRQRTPAERRSLRIGGLVLALALLYAYAWQPLSREREQLRAALPQMRSSLQQMRAASGEVQQLRALSQQPAPNTIAQALAYVQARSAAGAPSQVIALDAGHARVSFDAVAFDDWIDWTRLLQFEQGIRVQSANVVALSSPGMVKVEAELTAPSGTP